MPRTKSEAALEAAERTHEGDPERADALARARRFKASWVELAETLTAVRKSARFKRWGYGSFEEYAQKELLIKRDTADKLTASFAFLQQRAPEVLRRDGVHEAIPSFQAVDFLRRAEESEAAPETLEEIRRRVIDEVAPATSVTRQYREVVFPLGEEKREGREAAALRQAARRLRELLEEASGVPKGLAKEVAATLDELLAALDDDGA